MNVLKIMEPWASLIACGAKEYHTAKWYTRVRGPVAIFAGDAWHETRKNRFTSLASRLAPHLHPGCVVAEAELAECVAIVGNTWEWDGRHVIEAELEDGTVIGGRELTLGLWSIGHYAYRLERVKAIEPVPMEEYRKTILQLSSI